MVRIAPLAAALLLLLLLLGVPAAAGCGPRGPAPPPAALQEGERALEEGRFGEAARLLRSIPRDALATAPDRRRAAAALMKVDLHAEAADLLAKDPPGRGGRNGEAALLRLEALLRSGRTEEAQRFLAEMEIAGQEGERKRVLRVMLDLRVGATGDAMRELEDLVSRGTRDADAWVLWAQAVLHQPEEAEKRLLAGAAAAADRAKVLRSLGRLLLRSKGDPHRARDLLEEAVRGRPWDREARLDLVGALRRTGVAADLDRALAEARRLREEEPGDFELSLCLAETLGEAALGAAARAGGQAAAGRDHLLAAIALYGDLARRPAPDPVAEVRVVQGLARAEVEAIHLDSQGDAGPASHFRRALDALQRAEALDPEGKLRDPRGPWPLLAETWYLRGRAFKRVHAGDGDHTEAVGWYEKAARRADPHLDALWDLSLLYCDFLRTPDHVRKAAAMMRKHERMREELGLPPLDAVRKRQLEDAADRAAKGKGFGEGEVLGEPGTKGK